MKFINEIKIEKPVYLYNFRVDSQDEWHRVDSESTLISFLDRERSKASQRYQVQVDVLCMTTLLDNIQIKDYLNGKDSKMVKDAFKDNKNRIKEDDL